ncbi:hypothetical protein R5R35_005372 [Gryllus longicercus]|uniref:Fatty acid hydroxylase domain-containing protein n=1 Tax=Gryllus longicercus TaxID=2509291 RepID=A0AAN9V9N3_9ORTH
MFQKLVDWNKPMLKQVGKLGARYSEWVQSPVDRKLRLFESDFVEKMTVTPWYLIPIIWIPLDVLLLYKGYSDTKQYFEDTYLPPWVLFCFASGFLLWTLLEYSIHRWLFHLHPPDTSPRLITFHFLMHGLHHKVPFDESRLLIPPAPAAIVVVILYCLFYSILPLWMMHYFVAGILAGYVVYDLTHFYLHYGSPRPNTFFYHMKRYHNHHHFTEPDNGYGISCDIWDRVFRTQIYLKKLKFSLRW